MKWLSIVFAVIALQSAKCETPVQVVSSPSCDFVENCRSGYVWDDATCFCERVGLSRPTCDFVQACAEFFHWDSNLCSCVAAVAQTLPAITRFPLPPTRSTTPPTTRSTTPPPTRSTSPPCVQISCRNRYVWLQEVDLNVFFE